MQKVSKRDTAPPNATLANAIAGRVTLPPMRKLLVAFIFLIPTIACTESKPADQPDKATPTDAAELPDSVTMADDASAVDAPSEVTK